MCRLKSETVELATLCITPGSRTLSLIYLPGTKYWKGPATTVTFTPDIRLIVERLQLGDYFLRLSGVYLQKPSTSTPVPH